MVGHAAKCALLLWVLAFAASPRRASADPADDSRKLQAEAGRLSRRHPAEALAKLKQAYEVYPTPAIFLPMAQIEEKLGMKLEALAHYEAVVAADPGVVEVSSRTVAQARILELELEIATLVLDVKPVGARVLVDGNEVGVAPINRPVRVIAGRHTVRVELAGYDAVEKSHELQPGDRVEQSVQLSLEQVSAPPVAPPRRPVDDPDLDDLRASRRQVLIASLGFTGVFTVAAVVTGVLAVAAHGRYSDEGGTAGERESARDSGRALAITTDILLGGALVAGAFATYWYFARVRPISKTVTPYVALPASGVAVGIQGRF